jgi:nucleotide-binding universal stress UspA family protein
MVIIAAIDRSDRAAKVISEAETLARAFDDTVHVVYAITPSEFVDLEQTSYNETGRALPMKDIKSYASEYAESVSDLEVEHESVGLVGPAADEVVRYAAEVSARYIIVASQKRSPTGKALFGSVAQSILLNSDCPVVSIDV